MSCCFVSFVSFFFVFLWAEPRLFFIYKVCLLHKLQNQEALESSTVEHMHSHKRHVHSQPPGVPFLHDLSLFTASFLVSQARPTFAKKGRTEHTVKPYPVHRALPFFAEVGLAC